MAEQADLVERALSGDQVAFARLVADHETTARRIAVGILGSADGDDAVQEAIVKAYLRLGQFDHHRNFRPWFLAIVANEARNHRRAAGRRSVVELRVATRRDTRDTDTGADPAAAAETRLQHDVLARAVGRLAPADREVIALRYFGELSEAETAVALACAVGTVKSRLHRALGRLRLQLQEEVAS